MNDPTAWYCIHTKPKCEHLAAAGLRSQFGLDVYCPRIRFQRSTPRGKVWFVEALFPSYFFARFDVQEHMRAVRSANHVIRIIEFGGILSTIPNRIIEDIRAEMLHSDVREVRPTLKVGDHVELTEGPMRGFSGIIEAMINGQDRVRILLEFLGRQSFVEVEAGKLLNDLQPRSVLHSK
jgi:transcription elongation factor/antiterminator RfaH